MEEGALLPGGNLILVALAVLVVFGWTDRVLARLHMTPAQALAWLGALLAGSFVNVTVVPRGPELVVNVGGGLVPLALGVWVYWHADTPWECSHMWLAALASGAAVWGAERILPVGPAAGSTVSVATAAVLAAIVGYAFGRSRRAAFVGGSAGVVVAGLLRYAELVAMGIPGRTWLGGGGAFDAAVIGGVLAMALADVLGELRERWPPGRR